MNETKHNKRARWDFKGPFLCPHGAPYQAANAGLSITHAMVTGIKIAGYTFALKA